MQNNESTSTEDNPEKNPNATPEDAALADLAAGGSSIYETERSDDSQSEVDLSAGLADAEARVLRSQAELENFRKRSRRERDEERKYASVAIIRDIIPVIDNLQRAIGAVADGNEPAGLAEGVKMVLAQLTMVLAQHNCTKIEAVGLPFDPMNHEAVAQRPSDEFESGVVLEIALEGYQLLDRVIRPAQVVISQGPATG